MAHETVRSGDVGAVEVILSWGGAAMDSELAMGADGMRLVVGPSGRFVLPTEVLDESFDLVTRDARGFVLRIPAGTEAIITQAGVRVDVASLKMEPSGERELVLSRAHLAEVRMGDFAFFVRPTDVPAAMQKAPWMDLKPMRWIAAALAVHAAFIGIFALTPPNASALSMDLEGSQQRYVEVSLAGLAQQTREAERVAERAATQPDGAGAAGDPSETSQPTRGGGERGAPRVTGGPGRAHGGSRSSAQPTADRVRDLVSQVGDVFASSGVGDPSDSPFSMGNPMLREGAGGPGLDALRQGQGDDFGGLRMTDAGHGTCTGEHCSEGTIQGDGLHTHGDDHGVGDAPMGDHRDGRVPGRIHTPEATVMGGLTRDDVRRVVRSHMPEVRFCYEQSLVSRPDLEGRVAVRFVVTESGAVQSAVISEQAPGTERVASCVSSAVRRWAFPRSQGATAVTYPFVLQSTR